ncbi:hypothetical protein VTJ04DRAFT_2827 [Mycothermus thermophilus]|uniref:uncharacterized protein n=1 Tax=Humicola insolens TaxID=85995 RepID=UPI003743C639
MHSAPSHSYPEQRGRGVYFVIEKENTPNPEAISSQWSSQPLSFRQFLLQQPKYRYVRYGIITTHSPKQIPHNRSSNTLDATERRPTTKLIHTKTSRRNIPSPSRSIPRS